MMRMMMMMISEYEQCNAIREKKKKTWLKLNHNHFDEHIKEKQKHTQHWKKKLDKLPSFFLYMSLAQNVLHNWLHITVRRLFGEALYYGFARFSPYYFSCQVAIYSHIFTFKAFFFFFFFYSWRINMNIWE